MRRAVAALAWIAGAAAAFGLVHLAVSIGAHRLSDGVPFAYGIAVVGLTGTMLFALGAEGPAGERWLGAHVLVKVAAVGCAAMREPGHAWAAAALAASATAGVLVVAELSRGRSIPAIRSLRAIALMSLAGVPPLPGFFASVDLVSALMHARLPWLAAVSAVGSVAGVYVVARVLLADAQRESDAGEGESPLDEPAAPAT